MKHLPKLLATSADPGVFHRYQVISWLVFALLVLYFFVFLFFLVIRFTFSGLFEVFCWLSITIAWGVVLRTLNRRVFLYLRIGLLLWLCIMFVLSASKYHSSIINEDMGNMGYGALIIMVGLSFLTSWMSYESIQVLLAPYKVSGNKFEISKKDYDIIQDEVSAF